MNDFNTLTIKLLEWYDYNKRNLPWRETKNPYNIWVSEIILQQTRVNQGIDYYIKFVNKFESVVNLAKANIDDVLKIWQGLGYYSRARNMHTAAKQIVDIFNCEFPNTIKELKSIKGIGDYTAAAIASISFNLPVAAVDGNVYRVLSRVFGISTPIGTNQAYKEFEQLSSNLLSKFRPGDYNQALMELGAIICLPQKPNCNQCPLQYKCFAFEKSTPLLYPVKPAKAKVKDRYFYYLVIECKNNWVMQKRGEGDIWQNLCDFPLIESELPIEENIVLEKAQSIYNVSKINLFHKTPIIIHKLTHRNLHTVFYHFKVKEMPALIAENYFILPFANIKEVSVPRLIDKYIKNEFGFKK